MARHCFVLRILPLFILLFPSPSFQIQNPLTEHTGKIESDKWNLYFTPTADIDLQHYQQVHAHFESMEILCVALINQHHEMIGVVTPPPSEIFPLRIEIKEFSRLNRANTNLMALWAEKKFTEEQKEATLLQFIHNALQNPLGALNLIRQENALYLAAKIDEEKILFPLSFVKRPIRSLFWERDLENLFQDADWKEWDEKTFLLKLKSKLKKSPPLPVKKSWYLLSTETSSQFTAHFQRWLQFVRAREPNLAYVFKIHSHPYPQQWRRLIRFSDKLPSWAESFDFVLLPSSPDIVQDLEGIIPFAGIYSFDPDEKKPYWAYYPIDNQLLNFSNQIALTLTTLQERALTDEEMLQGKEATQKMIQKRAQVTRSAAPIPTEEINRLRKKEQLKQLHTINRQMGKNSTQWASDWAARLAEKKELAPLQTVCSTWDYFVSLHPFPKELTATLFFISNQMQIQILKLEIASPPSEKKEFVLNESLLFDLEETLQKDFSSQKELLQKLQTLLLSYL